MDRDIESFIDKINVAVREHEVHVHTRIAPHVIGYYC